MSARSQAVSIGCACLAERNAEHHDKSERRRPCFKGSPELPGHRAGYIVKGNAKWCVKFMRDYPGGCGRMRDEVQQQQGFEGIVWVAEGEDVGPFLTNRRLRHLGGFGAGEWGLGELLLRGFGG